MNKHKKNRQAFTAAERALADYKSEPRAFERFEQAALYTPAAQPRGLNPFAGRKAS